MPKQLSAPDLAKLATLMGMTESPTPGKIAKATTAANLLLGLHGLSWADLLCPDQDAPPARRRRAARQPKPDAELAWHTLHRRCLAYEWRLSAWESEFLHGLFAHPRPSALQRAILANIAGKLRRAGCAL